MEFQAQYALAVSNGSFFRAVLAASNSCWTAATKIRMSVERLAKSKPRWSISETASPPLQWIATNLFFRLVTKRICSMTSMTFWSVTSSEGAKPIESDKSAGPMYMPSISATAKISSRLRKTGPSLSPASRQFKKWLISLKTILESANWLGLPRRRETPQGPEEHVANTPGFHLRQCRGTRALRPSRRS